MKIVHWDEMFHPSFGYQINLLAKFQAKQGHDVTVITSDRIETHPTFATFGNNSKIEEGDRNYEKEYGVKIIRLPIFGHYSGRVLYKPGFIKAIKKEKPDVLMVHTNDTLSAMIITMLYPFIKLPMVFDNHMLEMASKNKFKGIFQKIFRLFVTPVIKKYKLKVIRTQNDAYVNKCLGIPEEQTPFISFGSDTLIFKADEKVRTSFRKANKIGEDDFVIVYTGKLGSAKGGKLLAQALAKRFVTQRNVVCVIVGKSADDEYGKEVERLFSESENRIIRFPTQPYSELPKFYQGADLSVFARQCSLSFYDAQACGLPVVSCDNNINVERNSHGNGLCFGEGNVDDFRAKIQQILDMSQFEYEEMSKNAVAFVKESYSYEKIAQEYTDVMVAEHKRFYKHR